VFSESKNKSPNNGYIETLKEEGHRLREIIDSLQKENKVFQERIKVLQDKVYELMSK
jgi:hypothetical protein